MSDMRVSASSKAGTGATQRPAASPISEPTGWVGWAYFAGIMMVMVGAFQIIQGLTALFNQHYLLVSSSGLLVHVDLKAWGWTHLVIGAIALVAGFAIMYGQMWARVTGIILAGISAIVNLAYTAAYPLWSIIIIAVDVLVIYALSVHGGELKAEHYE